MGVLAIGAGFAAMSNPAKIKKKHNKNSKNCY